MPSTRIAMLATAVLTAILLASVAHAEITDVRINEAYTNPTGASDATEFIELYGPPGTDLTGLSLIIIDGDFLNEGVIDQVVTVTGILPADGLWVIGQTTTPNPGIGNPPDQLLSSFIENNTQTYLLVTGFTGAVNDDVDTDNNGVADASYTAIGTIVDSVAVNDGGVGSGDFIYYDAVMVGPNNSGYPPAGIARASDGEDTDTADDWCITSFDLVPPATGTGSDGYQAASPGVANSYNCHDEPNTPPTADSFAVNVQQDTSPGIIITLLGDDADQDPLTYIIVSLPASGALTDPNNGDSAVFASTTLTGDDVRYTPATGVSGDFSFTYKVNDGTEDSSIATVTVHVLPDVPPGDRVIITEIMYNPITSSETGWEWVEVTNVTANGVALSTIYDSDNRIEDGGNLTGKIVPANGTVVITRGDITGGRLLSSFLADWSLSAAQVLAIDAPKTLPTLNNTGDIIRILDAQGIELDRVAYLTGTQSWPASTDARSIYLKGGHISTTGNDAGANWALSATGTNGAYTSQRGDIGSPGTIPAGTPPTPPVLVSTVSRRTHNAAGDFDINPANTTGIECRAGGPTLVVVTFDKSIQQVSGTNADVSLSSGSVSSLTVAGAELRIAMSGATPATPLTIGFPGIATAGSPSAVATGTVCIRVLAADTTGDAAVNIFDLIAIRNQLNQPVTAGNFRMDVNADGLINIFDLIATRNVLNQSVAACGS